MKRLTLLILLLAAALLLARTGGKFGLGGVLGDPTGLSYKYWLSGNRALSGTLAIGNSWHHHHDYYWYHRDNVHLYLSTSHLWHDSKLIPVSRGSLPIFWGIGGRLLAGNDFALGVRGNAGLAYQPVATPIDIFFDLGLVIDFVGEYGPVGDAGLGLRYYF